MQHIMIDLGTGNNNKINWAMTDKQELIDIIVRPCLIEILDSRADMHLAITGK